MKEETGLSVRPVELVEIDNRQPDEHNPHGFVGITYLCEVVDGELELSHEGDDLQFWDIEDVPQWHKDHFQSAQDAMNVWRGSNG